MLGKAREQVNVRQEMPLVRLAPKQSSLLSFRSQVYRRHKTALRNDNHLWGL